MTRKQIDLFDWLASFLVGLAIATTILVAAFWLWAVFV